MIGLKRNGRSFVFLVEAHELPDNHETQAQFEKRVRSVRGVSQVQFGHGLPVIYIQSLGRGPLQCEHELSRAVMG